MATELAKAYVQIIPSAKGIKGELEKELGGESASAGNAAGELFGSNLVGKIKGLIAAAGIGVALKAAVDEGGKLQQSFGGLDTIYGEASGAAKEYAYAAAQAGISANDYAEQAVSFGASLKQAFAGDTTKAVQAANTAIMDMTDNAAKMGTPIDQIQHAYQGFAKQNYTMLDNLKLGFGGTKSEMERLLATANEINKGNGIISDYQIENLGDVYDAIHVIQQDLGLTGVAAMEASETFSGSFGAMQASLSNFLAALSLGEGVDTALMTLINSTTTFLANNLIPMIGNVVSSIPTTIGVLLTQGIPAILASFQQIFAQLMTMFGTGSLESAQAAVDGFLAKVPDMITAGGEMLLGLIDGIGSQLPGMITQAAEVINQFLQTVLSRLPEILDSGAKTIEQLSQGMLRNVPQVISAVFQALQSFLSTILSNLPQIVNSGVNMLNSLAQGIIQNRVAIMNAMRDGIMGLLQTIIDHLPQILEAGVNLIVQLAAGIIQAVPQAVSACVQLISDIISAFTSQDWGKIGSDIISGIARGIASGAGRLKEAAVGAAKSAFEGAKSFLGIASPSKLFRDKIGAMMAEGMVVGFEDRAPEERIANDVRGFANVAPQATGPNYGGFNVTVYQAPGQSAEELVDVIERELYARIASKKAVFG